MATPSSELAILLKALHHLVRKGRPVYEGATDGRPTGYRVPVREFERVRCKVVRISEAVRQHREGTPHA